MALRPDQVNGQLMNSMPPALMEKGIEKLNAKEHLWLATVVFEMPDDVLKKPDMELDLNRLVAQQIRCVICGMMWKRNREGRICLGIQKD